MLDTFLKWMQRLSLVGFMISAPVIFLKDLFFGVVMAVVTLYFFILFTWVYQARKNEVNIDIVTKQIATIALGTVLMTVIIVALFNLYSFFG